MRVLGVAMLDNQVGLLDVDICGPSVPRVMGLSGQEVHQVSKLFMAQSSCRLTLYKLP